MVLEGGRSAWGAYREAYLTRYGCEPVRNAQTNSILSQMAKRIPAADLPDVLEFFVLRCNSSWYMTKRHQVKYALSDAEALYTDWKTGRAVTQTEARNNERTINNVDVAKRAYEAWKLENETKVEVDDEESF
jgi:hypothetical protein